MDESVLAIRRRTGLVVAIDLEDGEAALRVAREAGPFCDAVKLGYPAVLASGLSLVGRVAASAKAPVICDFKIADIPPVSGAIAQAALAAGASAVICHAFAGGDSVAAVAEACRAKGALAIAVIEMSHEGGREFTQPVSERLLNTALAAGVTAIVAPATRPERIAAFRIREPRLTIFSPGAGAQGGSPRAAAHAGADFVIVGRTIAQAASPARAAAEAAAEVAEGAAARA